MTDDPTLNVALTTHEARALAFAAEMMAALLDIGIEHPVGTTLECAADKMRFALIEAGEVPV